MIKQGLDKLCLFCKAVVKKQGKYKKAQFLRIFLGITFGVNFKQNECYLDS